MGSLFRRKGSAPVRDRRRRPVTLDDLVPPPSREVEDRSRPMTAPEVDLKGKLPPAVAERLDPVLVEGCRAVLANPEEQEARWFGIFPDRLVELGRSPMQEYPRLLEILDHCKGGAITVEGTRYRLESFKSFNDFGDRLTLQFFEEGRFDAEQSIERRRENIQLVNRLKPATSLTAKNELDLYRVVQRSPRERSFVDVLVGEGVLTPEQLERTPPGEEYELRVLQGNILPRKVAALALAHYLGVEYIDVEATTFSKEAARLLDKEWELEQQVVPFARDDQDLKVAMLDPTDAELVSQIAERTGCRVRAYCSAAQDIMVMIHKGHKRDD